MTIFTDLVNLLAPYVGGTVVAGAIFWLVLSVVVIVALGLVLGKGEPNPAFLVVGLIIGSAFSYMVGWVDLWVVVFAGIAMLFIGGLGPVFLRRGSDV